MSTADEIIVRLTAQTDQFKAGMAESADVVKVMQDEMSISGRSLMDTFAAFDAIQKGSIKTAQDAAAAQTVLNDARASMAYTDKELAEKEALLAAAMAKLPKEAAAASSGLAAALTRNSRTAYSASALISDALTGQFSRSRREMAALANETGIMAKALQFALSPAGLFAEALLAIGVGVIAADDHYEKFEQTILSSGDIIGMTAGQLQTMSDDVGRVTGASFDAVDAINSIGRSGLFTGEQLRTAAEGAVYFSQVTGENMDKAARVIEQLREKPKEAIVKLNDQYHFLTQSQAELIVQLLQTGQNAQAAAVAVQAFHDAMSDRAQQMNDNTTALARDWHDVKQWTEGSLEALAEYLNMLGGSKNTTDQLNRAYIQLANDQSALFKISHPFTNQADAINKDMQAIDALRDKQAQEEAQAKKTAQANKDAATTLDNGVGKHGGGGMSDLEETFKEQEAAHHRSYEERLQDESDFLGKALENDKLNAAQRGDVWKRLQDIRHQMDEQTYRLSTEASRKAAEDAKRQHEKDAQSALRSLEEKRDATQQYAPQRVQIDAEIVQAAIQWYGRDSTAYRQALRQKQADADAWAKHETQLAVQAASDKHAIALQDIQDSNAAAKEEFGNREISAQQLLAIELQNNTQKILYDVEYYNTREKLAGNDVKAIESLESKLTRDIKKANAERVKDAQATQKEIARSYEQMMQPVTDAIQQSVNGMVQGTQTARQALANIGQSILAEFVSTEARSLEAHIANELAKTTVTQTGNAARVAADTAGQAESLAVQGESAIKWITTEAAKAAAGAFNALVAIPVVGPYLAVGASIAAGAAVLALIGRVASAEGGWERVPADGMMTQLHKDEMVLPAHIANPMRKMVSGGGNGGNGMNVHIHTTDSRDLTSYLKRNPGALRAALAHASRNGW